MSYPLFKFLRFAFCAYLICAGLLVVIKVVYLATPITDQDWFTGLIVHPAAGMLIASSDES